MLLLALAGSAQAHGFIRGSAPPSGGRLTETPTEIELRMSEAIDPAASKIEILDAAGRDRGDGGAYTKEGDASVLARAVALPGNGTYLVLWTAYWPSDGHITHGGFGFVVGNATSTPPGVPAGPDISLVGALLLTLGAGSTAIAAGALAFGLFVWVPSQARGHDDARAWRRLVVLAAGAASAGAVVAAFTLAYHVSLTDAAPRTIIFELHSGRMLVARALLLAAAAGLAWASLRFRPAAAAAIVVALAAAGTLSLSSHAYATGDGRLVALDLIHVVAASVWVGGLVALALVLPSLPPDGRAVLRFSSIALASVAVAVLSGAAAGLAHVPSLERLVSSTYGRVLIVKVVLVAGMVALGGLNRLLFVSRAADPSARPRFRRVLAVEITVGLLVLAVAGALATTNPNPPAEPPPARLEGTRPGENLEDAVRVRLAIEPAAVGVNAASVHVTHAENGSDVTTLKRVQLFLNRPDRSIATQTVDLDPRGAGSYSGNLTFARPGPWKVTVAIQRTDAFDDAATFELDVR